MMSSEYIKFVENDKNSVSDAIKPILSVGEFFFEAGAASRQAEVDELQKRIDEALKVCDNLRTDLIRENHVEYDKGWKDCATSIYHQLKGNKDEK